ncbi:MAG: LEA type 2 family protein [Salibacteraceae bacterium]
MKIINTFILFAFSVLCFSCIEYEPVELVQIKDANLLSLSPDGIIVKIDAIISNPNDYDIKLTTKHLNLYINDKIVGVADFTEPVKLIKNSNQDYSVQVTSSIPPDGNIDLGTIALSGLTGGLNIKVEGNIQATAKGLSKTIPISFSEKVTL